MLESRVISRVVEKIALLIKWHILKMLYKGISKFLQFDSASPFSLIFISLLKIFKNVLNFVCWFDSIISIDYIIYENID